MSHARRLVAPEGTVTGVALNEKGCIGSHPLGASAANEIERAGRDGVEVAGECRPRRVLVAGLAAAPAPAVAIGAVFMDEYRDDAGHPRQFPVFFRSRDLPVVRDAAACSRPVLARESAGLAQPGLRHRVDGAGDCEVNGVQRCGPVRRHPG